MRPHRPLAVPLVLAMDAVAALFLVWQATALVVRGWTWVAMLVLAVTILLLALLGFGVWTIAARRPSTRRLHVLVGAILFIAPGVFPLVPGLPVANMVTSMVCGALLVAFMLGKPMRNWTMQQVAPGRGNPST